MPRYGHFARNCNKKTEEDLEKEKYVQWIQVQKSGITNQNGIKKGVEGKNLKGDLTAGMHTVEKPIASSNHFVVLSPLEVPILEEGEMQQFEEQYVVLQLNQVLWYKLKKLSQTSLVLVKICRKYILQSEKRLLPLMQT